MAGAGSAPAAASSVMLSSGNISGALSSARACAAPASSSPAAAVSRLKLSFRRGSGPWPPPAGLSPAPHQAVKPIVEPMEHYTALLEMETAIWCRDHLFSPSAAVKPSPSLQAGLGALGSAALMATSNSSVQSCTWPEGS